MDEYRVLIVDDEEELVTTIAERLQIRGMQAQTATDGETALKMIEANPPQVVVLDVMMPGYRWNRNLKTNECTESSNPGHTSYRIWFFGTR